MKKGFLFVVAAMLIAGFASSSYGRGTADEAKTFVDKAISFHKANGKEKTLAEVSNRQGPFAKDDLYVFVLDMSGTCLAHGANAKLIGGDLTKLRDYDGRYFIQEIVAGAKTKGAGWVDYHWENPSTKTVDKKSTYFKKDGELIYGCGIYKP